MQAVIDRQKGGHGPRRSMRRSWKLGTRSRHVACSSWQKCGVLRRKFGQESRLIRLSHIQRCRSFSERVGPRIMLLESEPGKESSRSKRSREIMHQSFETPAPPPFGPSREITGTFTSGTLHFGSPVGGELAGGHGLRIPYQGNKRGSHSLVSTEFSNWGLHSHCQKWTPYPVVIIIVM